MEDVHVVDTHFSGVRQGFFTVLDGHAGKEAAELLGTILPQTVARIIGESPTLPVCEALAKSFEDTDESLRNADVLFSGATAISCLVREETRQGCRKRIAYCANAGDARIVLGQGSTVSRLTHDHKANDEAEMQRIKDKGGFVIGGRVNGMLAVARSLGDCAMKDFVTSTPFTSETELDEAGSCLILACDGVWDVLSDEQAVTIALKHQGDAQAASDALLLESLAQGSTDNITVVVVFVTGPVSS